MDRSTTPGVLTVAPSTPPFTSDISENLDTTDAAFSYSPLVTLLPAPARASRTCRTARGWRCCRDRTPMPPQRGATFVSSAAALAAALSIVLALAYWLLALEHHLEGSVFRTTAHAVLGVHTAHAADDRRGSSLSFDRAVVEGHLRASAPLLIRSHQMPVTAPAGSVLELTLGFKNATPDPWTKGTPMHVLLERREATGPSIFMADNWIDTMRAAGQDEGVIAPGALAFFRARFRVPIDAGTYTETFVLRNLSGTTFAESETVIEVTAVPATTPSVAAALSPYTSGPIAEQAAGSDGTDPFFIANLPMYAEEPTIRIGIDYTEPTDGRWFPHVITTDGPFRVVEESGNEVLRVAAGEQVAVDYRPSTATYHVKHGTQWYTVDEPVRFLPDRAGDLVHLPSYTEKLRWEGNTADNTFRGILEVRYVPSTERLWAINELKLEDYLRGLVETSDSAHPEFHKAQAVAARTFALYHIERGGKYQKGQFILRNDARDQVYRGENAARRRPNLVAAVEATHGIVVTHDGAIVVTPYFAQSNGQTKAWNAVWGGTPKAWLTSVADPICSGKREIGHGVGLAQRCAMELASQGWSWQSIVHHYYSGIQLAKVY